jgi:hypothetical protein
MLANASNAAKGLRIGGDRRKGSAAAMVKVQVQGQGSLGFGLLCLCFFQVAYNSTWTPKCGNLLHVEGGRSGSPRGCGVPMSTRGRDFTFK